MVEASITNEQRTVRTTRGGAAITVVTIIAVTQAEAAVDILEVADLPRPRHRLEATVAPEETDNPI